MSFSYASNRFHAFEPMTPSARMYRLTQTCDPAGAISVPVALRQGNAGAFSPLVLDDDRTSPPDLNVYRGITFGSGNEYVLDFSKAFNSRTCSTNGLKFHWSVEYEDAALPNPYIVAGITGYDSPVLRIKPNSLVGTGPRGSL